jgi:hypothetical protein
LQPLPLPNPVVNIQNAPNIPDPTGLANLMQILGKPDIFKDMTGLSENQKNALAMLQASFGAAETFGTMATTIKGKELDLQAIQGAKKSGTITNDQAEKAAENILPKSDDEKIHAAEKKMDFINDALQKGRLNEDQANRLNNEIAQDINPEKRILSRLTRKKKTENGVEETQETFEEGDGSHSFLLQDTGGNGTSATDIVQAQKCMEKLAGIKSKISSLEMITLLYQQSESAYGKWTHDPSNIENGVKWAKKQKQLIDKALLYMPFDWPNRLLLREVLIATDKLVDEFTNILYNRIKLIDSLVGQAGNSIEYMSSHCTTTNMTETKKEFIDRLKLSPDLKEKIFRTTCNAGLIIALRVHEEEIGRDTIDIE